MPKYFNQIEEKSIRRELRKEQTYCEKIIWMQIRNRQLLGVKFRRQYSIDKFIIDFYSSKLKLAIEIDGGVHELPEQIIKDKNRQKYLEEFGIKFVRITNEELLGNPNIAFEKLKI